MPRVPAIPHKVLQEAILAEDDVVDGNGNVAGPTASVWTRIAKALDDKVTPKNVYTYVHEHGKTAERQIFYEKLLQQHGINTQAIHSDSLTESFEQSHSADDTTPESTPPRVIPPSTTFKVVISPTEWSTMQPVPKTYSRRDRSSTRTILVMPPYSYESKIIRLLWEQHKIPCPYTFTHSYVSTSADRNQYILFKAVCKDKACAGSVAEGKILTEPSPGESVVLYWRASDTRGIRHQKKVQLRGEERQEVGRHLQRDSAARYRIQLAEKSTDPGDAILPPFVYTQHVLRKNKQEYRDSELNAEKGSDVVLNLQAMKHKEPFAGAIQSIGADEFFVLYRTPTQKEIYQQHRKNSYISLSVDATGSLVRKLPRPHGLSGHIFLYEGVVHTGKSQFPVLQMLSEKNDANMILYWLNEWDRSVSKSPQEVVVDNSAALKSALARSFCKCKDLKEVRDKCFAYLIGNSNDLPPCYLRIDVAHFMHSAQTWKVWNEVSLQRVRGYYMSCLGLLVKASSLEEFSCILRNIFTISMSSTEGRNEDGVPVAMEESLRYLSNRIKGSDDFVEDEENLLRFQSLPVDDESEENTSTQKGSEIDLWLKSLKDDAMKTVSEETGDRINPFYSTSVADNFERVCREFPLWSAVLVDVYKSPFLTASSAPVESDFKNVKKVILKGEGQPMRADKMVAQHIHAIEGICVIASDAKGDLPLVRVGNERNIDRLTKSVSFTEHTTPCYEEQKWDSTVVVAEGDKERYQDVDQKDFAQAEVHGTDKEHGNDKLQSEMYADPDPEADLVPETSSDTLKPNDKPKNEFRRDIKEESFNLEEDARNKQNSDETLPENVVEAPMDLNFTDNWRGLGNPSCGRRPSKRTKLDPNEELDLSLSRDMIKTPKVRILRNGNLCDPCAIGPYSRVMVLNTCPCDALCQVVASAYICSETYRQHVNLSDSGLLITARSLAIYGACRKTYVERAKALAKVLDVRQTKVAPPMGSRQGSRKSVVTVQYDCHGNAGSLASTFLKEDPSARLTFACLNVDCAVREQRDQAVIEIPIHIQMQEGLTTLSESVDSYLQTFGGRKELICSKCGSKGKVEVTIFPHLFINVDCLADKAYAKLSLSGEFNRMHQLQEIPTTLSLPNGQYSLAGVVAHLPGHYIGIAKGRFGWEVFNDLSKDLSRPIKCPADYLVAPHVLIYTV